MKRLTAWLTGVAGGVAAARIFRRASAPAAPAVREADPADVLRAKLAETKAAQADPEPEPEPAPAEEPGDPDARRRAVHERGRAAVDEMRGDQSS